MPNPENILRQTGEETFSALAFMFPVPPEEALPDQGDLTVATVTFEGPTRGWVELSVPTALLAPVAANMLGEFDETDVSDLQAVDALKELLNVLCGNLLPAVDSPMAEYHIFTPEIEPAPEEGTVTAQCRIDLDMGTVGLRLAFTQLPAACRDTDTADACKESSQAA